METFLNCSARPGQARLGRELILRARSNTALPALPAQTIKQSILRRESLYLPSQSWLCKRYLDVGVGTGETKIIQSPYFIKISLEVSHLILPLEDQNTCHRVTVIHGLLVSNIELGLPCFLSSLQSPSFLIFINFSSSNLDYRDVVGSSPGGKCKSNTVEREERQLPGESFIRRGMTQLLI